METLILKALESSPVLVIALTFAIGPYLALAYFVLQTTRALGDISKATGELRMVIESAMSDRQTMTTIIQENATVISTMGEILRGIRDVVSDMNGRRREYDTPGHTRARS